MTTKQDLLDQIEVLKKQVDEMKDEPISPYDDLKGAIRQGYEPGSCYVFVRDSTTSNWYSIKTSKKGAMNWNFIKLNPKKIVDPNWLPHISEGMPEFLNDNDILVVKKNNGSTIIKIAGRAGWNYGSDYGIKEFFILEKAEK